MVKINGRSLELSGTVLKDYLTEAGYDTARLAVEKNGEIVPKARYEDTVFEDGDVVEIVRFVGGG